MADVRERVRIADGVRAKIAFGRPGRFLGLGLLENVCASKDGNGGDLATQAVILCCRALASRRAPRSLRSPQFTPPARR
jgi:hypothetical protein